MNYLTKKRIAAFLGLALFAGASAGCNSGDVPTAPTPTDADKKATPPAPQGLGEVKVRGKAAGSAAAN
jgi:hypothetical protein